MSDITVIGLGNMGAALASALLASGRRVTVWNRSTARMAPLVAKGAAGAASLDEAVSASPLVLLCVTNNGASAEILRPVAAALAGRVVVDLSSGSAGEAEALVAVLTGAGAGWVLGMINAYPSGIGKAETAILCAGPEESWDRAEAAVRALGGASAHVGTTAAAIPALFAAMFTARQGLMFGLMYGAALCRRAGLPVEALAAQVPVTMGMAANYADLFVETVPGQDYADRGASVAVYVGSFEDVVKTYRETGTPDALPLLMRDLARRAMAEGLSDKELTAITELLATG